MRAAYLEQKRVRNVRFCASEMCQSGTEMSRNVRGLVGTEESVQLFGETSAEELRSRGAVEAQQVLSLASRWASS